MKKFYKTKKYNNAEDVEEFDERIIETYKEIQEKFAWKNVLVVAHAWVYRPFSRYLNYLYFEYANF